uniref:hypothetical protein n=1 Tax=Gynurincola endophyticus TaxID=2479004 RepID=UPI0018F3499D
DPRLGKFLSVDPLTNQCPMLTPYQFASNTPIWAADLDGAEGNPYYLMPNTRMLTTGAKRFIKFAGEVAEGIVETAFMAIGSLTEMPARIHYENKVGSGNVSTTFPLTGNQNLLDVGKGAVMAPIMTVQKILDDPGDGKNWGEGLVVAFGSSKVLPKLWVEKVQNSTKSFIGENTMPIAMNAKSPVVGGGAKLEYLGNSVDRIQGIATKYNLTITVVGYRAKGSSHAFSDWDYIIDGGTSKARSSALYQLPRNMNAAKDGMKRPGSEILKDVSLDLDLPHIIFKPEN